MPWHPNPGDAAYRHHERAALTGSPEDRSRFLVSRLRAGELPRSAVIWAARLGDPAALLLVPDAEQVSWSDWKERPDVIEGVSRAVAGRRWRRVAVAFAVDCAERVLPIFERAHPDDDRPREALRLARMWSQGKRVSGERLQRVAAANAHAHAANAAAHAAANAAAHAAAYAAAHAYAAHAYAANAAAHAAANAAAHAAAYAAANAANAAARSTAANANAYAANAAANAAAYAAANAAANATRRGELVWQKARLAQYALGEVVL